MRVLARFGYNLLAKIALLCIFSGIVTNAQASHNLAGEITLRPLGGGQYEVTLTTYTDPTLAGVDRCTADIQVYSASNNQFLFALTGIPRQNGPFIDQVFPGAVTCDPGIHMGEYIYTNATYNVKKNLYQDTVTLSPGIYSFYYFDMARYDNVINIPNAGNKAFTVYNTVIISPILSNNDTPIFLNHPIDFACTGRVWTHNPGGYDANGDSLVYSLAPCMEMNGTSIPTPVPILGYQFPSDFGGTLTIDPQTGLVTWDSPQIIGVYNLAIKVVEYRNGLAVDSLIRDMAIYVSPCDNEPPVIETITDTCVQAGDTLVIDIAYYDPDFPDDSIYCFLNNGGAINNGPFAVPISPATIVFNPGGSPPVEHDDTVRARITWITDCSHVRNQFYQVDLFVHDAFSHGIQMLSSHKVIKIRVKAPPLTGLTVTPASHAVNLAWDPHACPQVETYEIYRIIGGSAWQQDTICCDETPRQAGFFLVGINQGHLNTTFTDDFNGQGFSYGTDICYVVVGVFPDGLRTCATDVVCVQVIKDHAVLTQDSIDVTGAAGSIFVSWSQPRDIDPLFFPQPYTYSVFRADGISGAAAYSQVASGIAFTDTSFTDVGMNTETQGYRYRVDVLDANGELIADGNEGSSIFLTLTPGDHQMLLSWREFTPWVNSMYYIYRADAIGLPFALIDSVVGTGATLHSYLDLGLTNFDDYCYYVLSKGAYGVPDIKSPLLNASQKVCDSPRDFTPPCLDASTIDTTASCEALTVTFFFNDLDSLCAGDLAFYTVWISDVSGGPWTQIAVVDTNQSFYTVAGLRSISDCFGISATDTNGNQSAIVEFCFDNCPDIDVGNVFTPNGDGINDFFGIYDDRAVKVSRILVYDRWGNTVFENTNLPDVRRLWDGRTAGGREAPEGVYYYVIEYAEIRLAGDVPRVPLVGPLTLLR